MLALYPAATALYPVLAALLVDIQNPLLVCLLLLLLAAPSTRLRRRYVQLHLPTLTTAPTAADPLSWVMMLIDARILCF